MVEEEQSKTFSVHPTNAGITLPYTHEAYSIPFAPLFFPPMCSCSDGPRLPRGTTEKPRRKSIGYTAGPVYRPSQHERAGDGGRGRSPQNIDDLCWSGFRWRVEDCEQRRHPEPQLRSTIGCLHPPY